MPRRRRRRFRRRGPPKDDPRIWWVYVVQSEQPREDSRGRTRPGFFYVGCTTDPARRIRQHNGEIKGGGRYTSKHRPWAPRALYGPYRGQSNALKAEYALKHGKRGIGRTRWSSHDSPWCRGEGADHPWVENPLLGPDELLP